MLTFLRYGWIDEGDMKISSTKPTEGTRFVTCGVNCEDDICLEFCISELDANIIKELSKW